jgi:putative phosphoribosyl transferase
MIKTNIEIHMVRLLEDPAFRNRFAVFQDRPDAGKRLASFMHVHLPVENPLICAIPAGGVPIGFELASSYHGRMFLGVVRKLKVPWNPEAGFGSVTWDGKVYLNHELIRILGLTDKEIGRAVIETRENIAKRIDTFTRGIPIPSLSGRTLIITDDGLASGYTMMAAVEAIRSEKAGKIIVAVPTGSASAVAMISRRADVVVCLNLKDGYPFAVADAYRSWHDLDDQEVIRYLESAEKLQVL